MEALKTDLSTKSLYRNWTPGALDAFVHYGTRTTEAGALTHATLVGRPPFLALTRVVSDSQNGQCAGRYCCHTRSYPFIRPAVKRAVGRNKRISQHVLMVVIAFLEAPETAAVQINDILVDSGQGL